MATQLDPDHKAGTGFSNGARPRSVPGPFGLPVTLETLPPADTNRWVARRKAEVIAAINGGLLSAEEACARYRLSAEELRLWQEAIDRAGVPGLRVTRIQLYRDYHPRPTPRSHGGHEAGASVSVPHAAWGRPGSTSR